MGTLFKDILGSTLGGFGLFGGDTRDDLLGGLFGGGGDAPMPPNPSLVAAQQLALNRQAAQLQQQTNMFDQFTPYGSVEWGKTGTDLGSGKFDTDRYLAENPDVANAIAAGSIDSPEQHYIQRGRGEGRKAYFGGTDLPYDQTAVQRYAATQKLSPEQQQMLDAKNQIGIQYGDIANSQLGRIQSTLSNPIDFSQLGDQPSANMDVWKQSQQAIMDRQQPFFQRDEDRIRTQLANQGIQPGSEAYTNAMMDFNRSKNDFSLGAQNAAMGQMAQMYGLQGNQWDRGANAMSMERSIPINEMAAFMSGSAVKDPNFVGTPQAGIGAPDQMGAQYANYQAQVDQRNFDTQQRNAMIGGLAGTAGTMAMMSDRRLKKNIKKIGKLLNGLNVYLYDYIWGEPGFGVMADEVTIPGAVININGYNAVDYSMVH